MKEKDKKYGKVGIFFLAAVMLFLATENAWANRAFYHGERPARPSSAYKSRGTEHFTIFYKDKYFDPEPALKMLVDKFNIRPLSGGIKIKLYIDNVMPYTIAGARTIRAENEESLIHELTHVLFLRLNPHAPRALAEGIAVYAGLKDKVSTPKVAVKEILQIEREFVAALKGGSDAYAIYGKYAKRDEERILYLKGFYFVNNILGEKGIEAFKEFYKRCSRPETIQIAWNEIYQK